MAPQDRARAAPETADAANEAGGAAVGLVETMAQKLRQQIIDGQLVPGQRLSEAKLAAELEISRNTLREVFRLLTRAGLLRHAPNKGVSVAAPSIAAILDVYRVRRIIELPVLAQAQARHPAVAGMHAAIARAEAARERGDWRGVGSANMEFHAAIVALADSPRLDEFFDRICAELRLAFGLLASPEHLHAPYLERNRMILALLEAGEAPEAARMLGDYLDVSERNILAALSRLARD